MTRAAWLPFQSALGSGWLCSFGTLIEREGEAPVNNHGAHAGSVPLLLCCKGRQEGRAPGKGRIQKPGGREAKG